MRDRASEISDVTEQKHCTWGVEKLNEDDIAVITSCGAKAYVEFSEIVKVKGKIPRRIRYPRCRKHATKRTLEYAEKRGYKTKFLEDQP